MSNKHTTHEGWDYEYMVLDGDGGARILARPSPERAGSLQAAARCARPGSEVEAMAHYLTALVGEGITRDDARRTFFVDHVVDEVPEVVLEALGVPDLAVVELGEVLRAPWPGAGWEVLMSYEVSFEDR